MKPLSTTFRVGRFTCAMSLDLDGLPARGQAAALVMNWTPCVPGKLSKDEIAQYRRGRDAFMGEVAKAIGGSVLVAEV